MTYDEALTAMRENYRVRAQPQSALTTTGANSPAGHIVRLGMVDGEGHRGLVTIDTGNGAHIYVGLNSIVFDGCKTCGSPIREDVGGLLYHKCRSCFAAQVAKERHSFNPATRGLKERNDA